MGLKDTVLGDVGRVFFNPADFASQHRWDDTFIIVVDDREEALKRKQGNVMDLSWENAKGELLIHVPMDQFTEAPRPETLVRYDGLQCKVVNVGISDGVYDILLVRQDVR